MKLLLLLATFAIAIASAQTTPPTTPKKGCDPNAVNATLSNDPHETALGAEFRKEREALNCSCAGLKSIFGCLSTLFTDHPLHIAVGSLAPGNGVGGGVALVTHWTPNEDWRLNWDLDAVATSNGSWRAGAYMTAIWNSHVPHAHSPSTGGGGNTVHIGGLSSDDAQPPIFHLYAQTVSLNKLAFFGEGPNTSDTRRSYYGMRETVLGTNVVWPLNHRPIRPLKASLRAEANGRFVAIRPSLNQASPSIEQLYNGFTAPGLYNQAAAAQFGQGFRIEPSFVGGHIRLDYAFNLQEYVVADSTSSFERFTVDLLHQYVIHKNSRLRQAKEFNGPDSCSEGSATPDHRCPPLVSSGQTEDRTGSVSLRFLLSDSFIPRGHIVPFYFQPTLGGSDINGTPSLGSYQDYRFRAPNIMLFRGAFEHSLPGKLSMLGVAAMADAGNVAMRRQDLGFTHILHSYSAGLTLRAGGFPAVWLLFSWGGREGTHHTVRVDPSLLGGSARPSLF